MVNSLKYIIPYKGFSEGVHFFEWNIDKSFFAKYEESEIGDANIAVQIEMRKHDRFLEFDVTLNGWAEVPCDRCLDPLKVPVDLKTKLYVEFGHKDVANMEDAEDADIMVLPYDEDQVDLAHYLYECAHLGFPMRRVHEIGADGKSLCNEAMVKKLTQYIVGEDDSSSDPQHND